MGSDLGWFKLKLFIEDHIDGVMVKSVRHGHGRSWALT